MKRGTGDFRFLFSCIALIVFLRRFFAGVIFASGLASAAFLAVRLIGGCISRWYSGFVPQHFFEHPYIHPVAVHQGGGGVSELVGGIALQPLYPV